MQRYISPAAAGVMRRAIVEAGGGEVFFLGRTDSERLVVEVEVLARGSESAVPAILQLCRYGDVVIHNHPSGVLRPSAADIEVASRLGALGVGFQIVDNPVENVYSVVEAFAPQETLRLDPQEIAGLLGADGPVAGALPGYEDRPEQLRMALTVAETFNSDRIALIEAGTGTGKSLAYLVPALLWALKNGERVVVSTNTINLQEQLIRKDLPFLRRAAGLDFRAVLVKGRGNYLCLRRTEALHLEPGLFDEEHGGELQAIIDWAETTQDGSRDELPFLPAEQSWEEVCCELDQCSRARCGHFSRCFFHKARRQAAQADLLVVNHALLLADLALRHQSDNYSAAVVLPPFERMIIDEAHHLEEVATRFFSTRVNRFVFARVLNRLSHPRRPERGLLGRLLAGLARDLSDQEDELYRLLHGRIEAVLQLRQDLAERAVAELEAIGQALPGSDPEKGGSEARQQRVVPAFAASSAWGEIRSRVELLGRQSGEVAAALRQLLADCLLLPEKAAESQSSVLTDLRGLLGRLEGIVADLALFVGRDGATCTWLDVGPGRIGRATGLIASLCTAPLAVAEGLRQTLFERFRSVVLTSATLAVGPSFAYFKTRAGLDWIEAQRLAELLLPSPFDYAGQALVAIPADLPEPGRPGYVEAVRDLTEQAVLAADGRSFVLFTAYSLLRRVHGELSPVLEARGYRCLRQGEENRHRLLKRFAADHTSVLFATDSFWEGVDVPGRSLEQVIITRLPFRVPTEPVLEARAEAIEAAGGDPFMEYTVPQAVLKFKQGFGRLIRHRGDRGVVLILDSRVLRKGYGRIFLRSLPGAPVAAGRTAEVMSRIVDFFRQGGAAVQRQS